MDQLRLDITVAPYASEPEGIPRLGFEASINGYLVAHWEELPLDINALLESTVGDGNFYFWTCTCGIPACAGLHAPIQVMHVGEVVEWRGNVAPIEHLAPLRFEKTAYVRVIERGLEQLLFQYQAHRFQGTAVGLALGSEESVFWRERDRKRLLGLPPLPSSTARL